MALQLQKFPVLVENMAAAVQGGAAQLIDLSVGSVLRALLEASAASALWMQWLILQVLEMTRAATSVGPDLDSWMADFNLFRLPGSPSNGLVSFARYTTGLAAAIPMGTVIYATDRLQRFIVVADPSNAAWNGSGSYILTALSTSVLLPVQALTPGISGNILPGAIGWLLSAIPGVDFVSNPSPFSGGIDPERDADLRARFLLYINSRSLATVEAINFAISTSHQGIRYTVIENSNTNSDSQPGNFWVVVDDGSGLPTGALLAEIGAAVEAVRPIGATYSVTGPAMFVVSVQILVQTSNAATHAAVCAAIQVSITSWIAGLPIAGTLAPSKLEALAHNTDESVMSVVSALINGAAQSITAPRNGVIIGSIVEVS